MVKDHPYVILNACRKGLDVRIELDIPKIITSKIQGNTLQKIIKETQRDTDRMIYFCGLKSQLTEIEEGREKNAI